MIKLPPYLTWNEIWFGLFCLITALQVFYYLWFFQRLAFFRKSTKDRSQQHPVSVVICARDEAANLAAAEAAWTWLLSNSGSRPRVIAGWSLGAAVAAQLAARHHDEPAGVMLLSAWDRLDAVARLHFPGWMVGALLSERYESVEAAKHITAPALLVHGDHDTIIPIELGRQLYAALPGEKQWVEVRGAGHNDLLSRPEAWQAIHVFLSELPKRRAS